MVQTLHCLTVAGYRSGQQRTDFRHSQILYAAIGRGYLEVGRYLLTHGLTPSNDDDLEAGTTGPPTHLHLAASMGNQCNKDIYR
ncbi:hypothetical protein MW887_006563 [Aspergillus wentii]|nr:hypothetical protein MW887_006563 [Aspergillus wentii]